MKNTAEIKKKAYKELEMIYTEKANEFLNFYKAVAENDLDAGVRIYREIINEMSVETLAVFFTFIQKINDQVTESSIDRELKRKAIKAMELSYELEEEEES